MCNLSEGIERRGIKKSSLEIARNLLSEGISPDVVKRTVPDVTSEELSAILKDVRKQ